MATRSRKTPEASTAAPTASQPPATGPGAEQSQNIWLAGLGAMARAQAEGSKAFDALVKQGLDWQSQAREQIAEVTQRAEALAASAAPAAAGRWNALEGIFDTKLFFKGKPGEHLDWSIDVDAKSDRAVIKNHPLTDVKIAYLQRDKNISKLNMNADVYGGKLKFDSSANLENTNFPFVMALGIYDTDLAKFIVNQTPDKENKLAGTFSLNLGLEGELTDQQSWTGQGDYKIENGYIWDFKIIKVLNKLLIREFVRTVYTDSSANFRIANRKIGTENLTLKSDTISLLAKGYVDFDQKLSFDVYPALSEIARIQSDDEILKKFTTVLLSKTLNIIKLGGTIQEPKHSIVATQIPTNILKGTLDTIRGVGESLFETIINP